MGKIRTANNLLEAITEDITWRKKEISYIYFQVQDKKAKDECYYLIRCGILILYAHWEGFVKKTTETYLELICNKGLKINNIITPLRVLHLKKIIYPVVKENNTEKFYKAVCNFIDKPNDHFNVRYGKVLSIDDNLNSNVFRNILSYLGLDYTFFKDKEDIIDSVLVHNRNNIAHGQNYRLSFQEYEDLHTNVLALIESFRTEIENKAVQGKYKIN
jgi:hypothetical protein